MTPSRHFGPAVGVAFKHAHFDELIADKCKVDFVEVHAENCMGAGGESHAQLDRLRARMPLSVHGVGLSIGAGDALDLAHLARLKRVVDRFEPALVSEHLAWSSHAGHFFNDLMAPVYDERSLSMAAAHVSIVQDTLGRRILLENPASYFTRAGSAIEEADFLSDISRRSGCGLLLDLNNVVVSCSNRNTSARAYLDKIPHARVEQIHLGGHSSQVLSDGQVLLIDDHGSAVSDAVWQLYQEFVHKIESPLPALIEWDTNVPAWSVLLAQVERARALQSAWGFALGHCAEFA